MEDDIIDILHRIAFDIEDEKLEKLTAQLRRQTELIHTLGLRQARLSEIFGKTTLDETKKRQRVISLMEKNKTLLEAEARATENLVIHNKQFNDQLVKEQGLIGAVNSKLQILEQRRKKATSVDDIKRYNKLIASEQDKLKSYNNTGTKGGGLPGGAQFGAISRMLPAIGGAISLGAIGSQIVDVTKKFEGYIQTLKNAYGSSIKAEGAFSKIQQFASKTPYSVDELTSSFIKLKNRGFDPTTAELTKMGDLAASQGKSFDQYTEALLDAQTGEYERLKEFGIKAKTAGDEVTFTFKGISKTVSKFSEVDIRNAILGFGELQGVAGGMAGQATTLNGKLSNLGDTYDMLLYNFSKRLGTDSFLGGLVEMANNALGKLGELMDNSKELAIQSRADATNAKALADEYERLAGKTKQTADEKDRLKIIQGQLVSILGDSVLMINKETGAYELNMKAVRELIRNKLILANTKAVDVLTRYNEGSGKRDQNIARAKTISEEIQAIARQDKKAYDDAVRASEIFQRNPERFDFLYNGLSKNAKRVFNLRGELRKANGQTLELNRNLNELAGDYTDITGGGAISQYYAGQLDLGDPTPEITPITTPTITSKTKSTPKKSDSPQEKELKRLADLEKTARAKEEERNNEFIKKQNEDKTTSQAVLNVRLQKNAETHEKLMNEITIKYSRLRSKFLKGGDLAEEGAKISKAEAEISEITKKIQAQAEAEIKTAIETFNELNTQLLEASDQTFELEMQKLDAQHRERLQKIEEDRKAENEALLVAQEKGNKELIEQTKKNLQKINDIETAEKERQNNEKVQAQIKHELANSQELVDAQILALNSMSEKEREQFEREYGNKKEQVDKEIELIKSKQITDEEIINESGRKKEKLKKEQANQEEKIALNREIAELYIRREGMKRELEAMKFHGRELEGQDKINNEKRIKAKQQALDENARQIRSASKKEEEDEEEKTKFTIEDAAQLADATIQASQSVVSAFEQQADKEIEIRQRRVDRAKEIADRGNAEALQLEEIRLEQAQKQKEKYARQQMALNLLQQISALALAIAQAAAVPFPANIGAIASVITSVGAGIATVMQMSQDSMPAFKDGVIDFQGKGTGTSDSNVVRISRGESIITAEATARNAKLLEMINSGAEIMPINYNIANGIQPQNDSSSEIADLKKSIIQLKDEVTQAILSKPNQSVEIDRNGIAVITEEVRITNRKRWNS